MFAVFYRKSPQLFTPKIFAINLKHDISTTTSSNTFYQWLTRVFNMVDEKRIKKVGPDRACAEWLIRNGAAVRWKGHKGFFKDYNLLPDEESKINLYIEAVDATDSSISHEGFPYFSGCKYFKELKLVKCMYLTDEGMPHLSHANHTLTDLEVLECLNLTDEGLSSLKCLTNLETLKLGGFMYVKNKDHVIQELRKNLPKCKIEYV